MIQQTGDLGKRDALTFESWGLGKRSFGVSVLALVGLDLFSRFISIAGGQAPLHRDQLGYWLLGHQMASGDWFLLEHPEAFRVPLYPAFLAVFQAIFDSRALFAAVVGQHLLGMATTAAMSGAAWLITSRREAFVLCYSISLLCLGAVQYANHILSESLFAFTIALHLLAFVWWHRSSTLARSAVMGGTLALTVLVRPTTTHLWILEILVLLVVAYRRKPSWRSRLLPAACYLAVFTATLLPWLARNQAAFGRLFLTAALGRCVWHCYFDENGARLSLPTSESLRRLDGVPFRDTFTVYAALRRQGWSEVESDRWMAAVAAKAVLREPVKALRGAARNWIRYWFSVEEAFPWYDRIQHGRETTYLGQKPWHWPRLTSPLESILRFVYRYSEPLSATWGLLAIAGAVALASSPSHRAVGLILLVTLLYFAAVSSFLILPLYRLRLPTQPIMIVSIVTGGFVMLQKMLTARKPRSETDSVAVLSLEEPRP